MKDIENKDLELNVLEKSKTFDNDEKKITWKSCCFYIDERAVKYFSQLLIIIFVMCFCIYQLINLNSCESQQAYLGLLTLVIGIILPNPKYN